MGRRGARESGRRGAGRLASDPANAILAILAAQSLSAWFDPDWTPGVTLQDDAGTQRMTEIQSRPISGQLQYSVPPVALSIAPATTASANGRRILTFDGSRYMGGACALAASFAGAAPLTAVSLGSRSAGGNTLARWSFADAAADDNRIVEYVSSAGDVDGRNRTQAGASTTPTGAVMPLNTVRVFSTVFTGTQIAAWMHGAVSIALTANTRAPAVLDELYFGAQRSTGGPVTLWRGLGGPLAICSGVLSDPDRQALESAFGAYYGYPI